MEELEKLIKAAIVGVVESLALIAMTALLAIVETNFSYGETKWTAVAISVCLAIVVSSFINFVKFTKTTAVKEKNKEGKE